MFKFILKCLALSFLLHSSAYAEQKKDFDNLSVHYIALPTQFLTPQVAHQYAIKRSKYSGLINISVLDNTQQNKAQHATLSGTGRNLMGQESQLNFTEVQEGEAIYYLATYPFLNEEIVNFKIKIKTEKKTNILKFQHKFYVN